MKTLFFGAGPLASVYAHLLHQNGEDVTVLAQGERYEWLRENGLSLVNEMTGKRESSQINVVEELNPGDEYELVIVLIRKNKLLPVFESLATVRGIENILFMGNNALGFDEYLQHLPAEKVFFGFPGAGGGVREQVVHYADREKPRGKRRAVTIGEIDGQSKERTIAVKALFESAGVPVDLTRDIDGWLKYHIARVGPLVGALYKHDCNNYKTARDVEVLRVLVRATKEGGRVLMELGFTRRQPFDYNLIYWLPEFMSILAVKQLLDSKFAEVAFALHAKASRDEMAELASDFQQLASRTSVDTPNIDSLRGFINQVSLH